MEENTGYLVFRALVRAKKAIFGLTFWLRAMDNSLKYFVMLQSNFKCSFKLVKAYNFKVI